MYKYVYTVCMCVCTYFHVEGLDALWIVDHDGRLPVDLYSYMHTYIHTYIHTDKGMMRNAWISQPNLLGDVSLMLGSQVVAPVRILLKLHLYKYFKSACMYLLNLYIHRCMHTFLSLISFWSSATASVYVICANSLSTTLVRRATRPVPHTYIHIYIHTYITKIHKRINTLYIFILSLNF